MFTLGGTELLLLGVLVLLLFGPDKIPQIARTVGRAMREFNKYKDIMESAFRVEMQAAEKSAAGAEGDDSMESLRRSAEASREYAAESGKVDGAKDGDAEAGEAGPAEGGEAADEAAPEHAVATIVTDEDEEEG